MSMDTANELRRLQWLCMAGNARYPDLCVCGNGESSGHNEGCPWLALMRKAGLR